MPVFSYSTRLRLIESAALFSEGVKREELARELVARVTKVQMHPSWEGMEELGIWLKREFPIVFAGRLPKGMGKVRDAALWFARLFEVTPSVNHRTAQLLADRMQEFARRWELLASNVNLLAQYFSRASAGGQKAETKIGDITIRNDAGVSGAALKRYSAALAGVFNKVKGWRRKALRGGLTVVLAPATAFRGTSSGRYSRDKDELLVRTTPKVMKGLGLDTYGSPEYILIHELGHRYERHYPLPTNFDHPVWYTTRYSMTSGFAGSEAFAELFALGHFGITKAHRAWDPEIQVRFEKTMMGQA